MSVQLQPEDLAAGVSLLALLAVLWPWPYDVEPNRDRK